MTTNNVIHLGFIGAGAIARSRHLPNLARIDGVKVQVVCNRSRESGQAVARDFDIPETETDWHKIIERDDLDAVFIGTWPYMHKVMSVAALEAGKHVFCQARMAMDLTEAKAMVAAAEAHPTRVHMICPPPHRMPWEPYVRHLLEADALGELREVRVQCITGANLGELNWRERVELSGQQVLQVGIWAETLNAWVGEYETLSATVATPIASKPGPDGEPYVIRIPQIVAIHGRLRNGAAISEHHTGVATHDHANFITLHGSRGTLRVDIDGPIQLGRPGEALRPADVPADLQRPWRVEQDFIEAVRAARAGKPWQVSPDFHEGLKYMRKVAAIHRSAETRAAVNLADL